VEVSIGGDGSSTSFAFEFLMVFILFPRVLREHNNGNCLKEVSLELAIIDKSMHSFVGSVLEGLPALRSFRRGYR
jgi:hypothetical protein